MMVQRPGGRILLCVAGGIAAYKAPELVRQLVKAGYEVRVVATEAALRFVSELSLSVVSGHAVRWQLLDPQAEGQVGHIELADWAQLVVVAPATANLLAHASLGLAPDLVSTVLLATRAPMLWAPAMNTNMWRHPAVIEHVATLRERGHHFVGPASGELACGWEGEGKMSDPADIVAAVGERLGGRKQASAWRSKRLVISAGPTRTYLDPVRFVSNASTGVMGFALATAFAERGAHVTLVSGPVALGTPEGVERVDVQTADEMHGALERSLQDHPTDLVCMVAAVSDLRISSASTTKLSKQDFIASLGTLPWTAERDVVASLARRFRPATRFLAFAAETAEGEGPAAEATLDRAARRKLAAKGADAIFVNRVGTSRTGMGVPTNAGTLLVRSAQSAENDDDAVAVAHSGPPIPKRELADWIADTLEAQWFEPR
ncbi:MAG: bifunctional phosphopantothenoylcysteine decarboxylase/phosphopantothenate--cysteine ligase CoaBC [Myxococcales bacterium FL481]|nr:MAG: bifunctional phosphopantothenoylcysteine decarboxylase/phosphopantothenate--cysteine ligase CoaBC [Myxococcales bacterium FL481]